MLLAGRGGCDSLGQGQGDSVEKPGAQEPHMLSPWGRNGLSMFKGQGRCGRRWLREAGRGGRQRAPR